MPYVLQDKFESVRQGRPCYFGGWTAIGPRCTSHIEQAKIFHTRQEAALERVCAHPLCDFEPVEFKLNIEIVKGGENGKN